MARKVSVWGSSSTVSSVEVLRGDYLSHGESKLLVGQKIRECYRAGKYMLFPLDKGTMVCHNAMSGYWDCEVDPWTFDYVEGKRSSTLTDVRVKIHLSDGKGRPIPSLHFHDSRLFGSLRYFDCASDKVPVIINLGAEAIITKHMLPGRPVFNVLDSVVLLSDDKPIKELLMRQERIAGVGNIYAVEALWRARIHPNRSGRSLTSDDHYRLLESLREVMCTALVKGLDYSQYLHVYRKKTCSRCGEKIDKIHISQRSTYFCAGCQR